MTEGRDPIQRYLDQLRLSLRIPEVGRILVEAEDHLREAAAAGMAAGLTEREAQEAAVAGFGPVGAIVYAHQTRHGRVAAMAADAAIAVWRVAVFCLLAFSALGLHDLLTKGDAARVGAVMGCAGTGTAGLGLLGAYLVVRRVQRRRGRVWSVPLGGYFPLAATIASAAVAVGMLLLVTSHVMREGPGLVVVSWMGMGSVGLAGTYGWRMWRMLRQQARGWRELA